VLVVTLAEAQVVGRDHRPSVSSTARSMAFSSSRMLPGQL
jgi:hypothetical protein